MHNPWMPNPNGNTGSTNPDPSEEFAMRIRDLRIKFGDLIIQREKLRKRLTPQEADELLFAMMIFRSFSAKLVATHGSSEEFARHHATDMMPCIEVAKIVLEMGK